MSVESATAQLAQTSLNDQATVGSGGKPINASQNEAVIASAAEGRRLYIGNLAYATTEGELTDFFKDYLVETTSIPTNPRNSRPVGYAFVDVSTPSEAERAIADLNGKTILDRKVSVQLARKPEPASVAPVAAASGATEGEEGEGTRRRASGRGGRGGRSRGRGGRTARPARDAQNGETNTDAAPTNVPGQVLPLTDTTSESLTAPAGADGALMVDATKTGQSKALKPRKVRGPPEDGVASKNKIMVANLPYEMREDKLMELFAEYSPSSVKIALRPIPKFMVKKLQARNEPRKGRGFGFVTLASEELQQKAVSEMNGKQIDGREIAVKVAIDSPAKENDVDATLANGAADADGAPSTAEGSGSIPLN